MTAIPLLTGPSDPASLKSTVNAVITQINLASQSDQPSTGLLTTGPIAVTAARIHTAASLPIAIISAPGSGKMIQIDSALLIYHFNTVAFATDIWIGFSGLAGEANAIFDFHAILTQATSQVGFGAPAQQSLTRYELADVSNRGVVLIGDADDVNGNGDVVVICRYYVIDV